MLVGYKYIPNPNTQSMQTCVSYDSQDKKKKNSLNFWNEVVLFTWGLLSPSCYNVSAIVPSKLAST